MPAAPRPSSKATKIAFKILGVPDNLRGYYRKPYERKKDSSPYESPIYGLRQ